jgi:DnaJ-class molecular chaperone
MEHIFTGFKDGLEGLDRNEVLSAKEDKNSVICQLITDMVAENKRFDIPKKVFGDATCPKCNGLGIKILFERELSVRTCLKCDGGKKTVPCKKCQNGRYIRNKGDLKINVECKFCHGTKQREVKCRTCRGTGELRKMVITPKIKSTTPCKHCREMGFIDEKIFALIDDTQKFEDAAEQLIDTLFTAPVETEDAPSDDANAPTDA